VTARPRFIAGAVCDCGALDRIVVERHDGEQRLRCVTCGATRPKPDTGRAQPTGSAHPAGRLETRGSSTAESARPIRLLDPKPGKKEHTDGNT
jgi:uncharacterized metal-binding protein (TIGR02443 family)